MTERRNAVAALRGALASRSSEAAQPIGSGTQAAEKAHDSDAFFVSSQKNAWAQRAEILRKNITVLYLRERETERQGGVWPTPTPAAPPVTASASLGSGPML